jgi:hypothetical protein
MFWLISGARAAQRRVGIVLDPQLGELGSGLVRQVCTQPEGHINRARDPGGRRELPVRHPIGGSCGLIVDTVGLQAACIRPMGREQTGGERIPVPQTGFPQGAPHPLPATPASTYRCRVL